MSEKIKMTYASFEKIVGQYRILVDYRNYFSPYMGWAQAFNSYYCVSDAEYVEGSYEYPYVHFMHCTAYSNNDEPIPISEENAELAIQATYKELTLTPEEKKARYERSERLKKEIHERLRREKLQEQGLAK